MREDSVLAGGAGNEGSLRLGMCMQACGHGYE